MIGFGVVMGEKRNILTVEEVNRRARMALEGGIGEVWVEGELSRLTRHASGHWYFVLKDERAAVDCAMFSRDNARVAFRPADGLKVRLFGRPSVYEATGRYQLIASKMEEAGKGDLLARFEALKKKLEAEGLFDEARKKPLPLLPRKIGVVTSPTGAAIRDVVQVLTRRFPDVRVLLAPVKVQGAGAAKSIAKAIDYLDARDDVDVLIVGRGGGSIEDLWCFNEEVVARAIARARTPIVSGIGHEIDFTIADFAADVRAPTPSAAAELAMPEKRTLEERILRLRRCAIRALRSTGRDFRLRLNRAAQSYAFREPGNLVWQYRQRVDAAAARLVDHLLAATRDRRGRLDRIRREPAYRLEGAAAAARRRSAEAKILATHAMRRRLDRDRQTLRRLESQLRALDPLAVLQRGYSVTLKAGGALVRSPADVAPGDRLRIRLAEGEIDSVVSPNENTKETKR